MHFWAGVGAVIGEDGSAGVSKGKTQGFGGINTNAVVGVVKGVHSPSGPLQQLE